MPSIEQRILKLRDELNRHNHLYYVQAKPEISDQAYDALMSELILLEEAHPDLKTPDSPSARVGGQLMALALFAVMFHWAGFIASAFVLVVITAMISGERSWLALLVAAVMGSVGIQYLFSALGTHF